MSLDTYANLKTEVSDWANRTDLPEDTLIDLAEAYFNRELRVNSMVTLTSFTIDARFKDVPSDFLDVKYFTLDQTDPRVPLVYMDPASFDTVHAAQSTGQPTNFTIVGGQFKFGPAPDTSYVGALAYYQRIPALSDSQTTNWLLTSHPDAYLMACRLQAALYLDPTIENSETQVLSQASSAILGSIDANSKKLEISTPQRTVIQGSIA